jgi:hypothetical protein
MAMHYDCIAIPDADVPQAAEPVFQHVVTTYAGETNKTVSVWRAVPDDLLDFKPHEKECLLTSTGGSDFGFRLLFPSPPSCMSDG